MQQQYDEIDEAAELDKLDIFFDSLKDKKFKAGDHVSVHNTKGIIVRMIFPPQVLPNRDGQAPTIVDCEVAYIGEDLSTLSGMCSPKLGLANSLELTRRTQ